MAPDVLGWLGDRTGDVWDIVRRNNAGTISPILPQAQIPSGATGVQYGPSGEGTAFDQTRTDANASDRVDGNPFREVLAKISGLMPQRPWQEIGDPNGGYSAAAALRAMLQQIDDSYNRQRGMLDQNKATSLGSINSAMDRYKQQIGSNYATYQNQSAATQQAIAQRIAEQQAAAQQRSTALQNSVGSVGGTNMGAIQEQAQGLSDALRASGGFQQDLSSRLAEVVANNQRQYENSGELVRQGATGTLENNYNAMLNMLLANMEQQKAQAQGRAYSGGGGGGGGATDYAKMAKNMAFKDILEWQLNGYAPSADDLFQIALQTGDFPTAISYLTSTAGATSQQGN